ncbi:MAG: hypothetical protein AAF468_08905 [Pseudomonadota bacterium]
MKRILFLLCIFGALGTTPALAKHPTEEQSCEMMSDMLLNQRDGLGTLKSIFSLMKEDEIDGITSKIYDIIKNSDVRTGELFEIGRLGNHAIEHLVAFGTRSRGSFYFRIIYEPYGGNWRGVRIYFNTALDGTLKQWPMMQQPRAVACSE